MYLEESAHKKGQVRVARYRTTHGVVGNELPASHYGKLNPIRFSHNASSVHAVPPARANHGL